jgi:hypothetical protein
MQVKAPLKSELMDTSARVAIYEVFVEGKLQTPKHLACGVRDFCDPF